MTRAEYEMAARRVRITANIAFPCIMVVGMVLVHFVLNWLESKNIPAPAKNSSDGLAGAKAAIVIGLLIIAFIGTPLFLFIYFANRLIGLRCPNCQRFVTNRRPQEVLPSGRCPFCQVKLF